MDPVDMPHRSDPSSAAPLREVSPVRLRLYIAGSTPNSVRAEHNLSAVLDGLKDVISSSALEIVDVFSQGKRAITDGVVVTPTLIGLNAGKRVLLMGDLADQTQLRRTLQDLVGSALRA
jgi:circadian clock protein KaiB